jgi:predicted transcriptional regulator
MSLIFFTDNGTGATTSACHRKLMMLMVRSLSRTCEGGADNCVKAWLEEAEHGELVAFEDAAAHRGRQPKTMLPAEARSHVWTPDDSGMEVLSTAWCLLSSAPLSMVMLAWPLLAGYDGLINSTKELIFSPVCGNNEGLSPLNNGYIHNLLCLIKVVEGRSSYRTYYQWLHK